MARLKRFAATDSEARAQLLTGGALRRVIELRARCLLVQVRHIIEHFSANGLNTVNCVRASH